MAQDAVMQVSASASRDADGKVHVSLCNVHHDEEADVVVDLGGMKASSVKGRILTAPTMNTMNTFERPNTVKPGKFEDFKLARTGLTVSLPPRSVVVLEVQ